MSGKAILCPICKKPVELTNDEVPFCSARCRLIDLGKWASGDYKVSSPVLDPDLLEEVEEAQLNAERRREGRDRD
jgi:hypothetical protein